MGLISKPNTFVAGTTKSGEAAQVNADFDTIYAEFNGNIQDANIKAAAGIQQSKILNLVSDLAALTNRKGYEQISAVSASNSATVNFTSGLTSTYNQYIITITDVVPATDVNLLLMRFSQSAVFLSGLSDYGWSLIRNRDDSGTPAGTADSADSKIAICDATLGNDTGESGCFTIELFNPAGTARYKRATWRGNYGNAGVANSNFLVSGMGTLKLNTSAIDGVQFFMGSGNIASGEFALYGLKK